MVGMECAIIQYPISSIHYSMMAGQIGYWLLAVGYLHIQHMLSFPSHGAGARRNKHHKGDMNMSTSVALAKEEALAKGDALRRGILVSSLARGGIGKAKGEAR